LGEKIGDKRGSKESGLHLPKGSIATSIQSVGSGMASAQ